MKGPEPTTGPLGEVTCVAADTFCVSGSSGQIRRGSEQGLFIRDTRILSLLLLRINGTEVQPLLGQRVGASAACFTGYWTAADDREPDPKLLVRRRRLVSTSMWEEVQLTNYGMHPFDLAVQLEVASDFAYIFDVKHGRHAPQATVEATDGGLRLRQPDGDYLTIIRPSPPAEEMDIENGALRWNVHLPDRAQWSLTLTIGASMGDKTIWPSGTWTGVMNVARAAPRPELPLEVRCSDERFSDLCMQAATDLESLRVPDPQQPSDSYFAAGSPWFLTLFGRDSIWAAMMALPMGVQQAGQTLRVLARRQGVKVDAETEEEPGKILHEARHGGHVERSDLPPLYYGSIDSTPLWIVLLHEAWRWGLDADEVRELLPAAERALGWLRDYSDADGDGFLEYLRTGQRSLRNQGWKDSEDGVQFADGRLAEPPIALCEVQGYACDAALRGAELLERFDRPGADEWRAWAHRLRDRFRESFWVRSPSGDYPAIAIDGEKRRVDSVASNMGHLPTTGLVDEEESALIARRLGMPDMNSGWGLRTLSNHSPRFNPLSYHGGSIWPHDTAIAAWNLAATGHFEPATDLMRGLVAAAPHFRFRLPELFGGEQRDPLSLPLPYPAACRPQAWAAGASLLLLRAALGLHPRVPDGVVELRPIWPPPYHTLQVSELRIGSGRLAAEISAERGVVIHDAPPGLEIKVVGAPHAEG
ncbi:MAG TPA: glycogen debranching N-terminal domain-containing protein [Egibacteraceae bacterium]|nr:glycogen debranching N-terminal domain-containing protein [Egibacteraceae bacterium]